MDRGNKRDLPSLEDDEELRKRTFCCCCSCHSFKSQPVLEADDVERVSAQDLPLLWDAINNQTAKRQLEKEIQLIRKIQEEATAKANIPSSKQPVFKLVFVNPIIASKIYTGNDIVAVDGKPLEVVMCDATDSTEIKTGPLSRVKVEIFVLPGEQHEETDHVSDFYKNSLFQRDGKRPLIVGDDQKLYLKDGVGLIENLSFTDNSSWTKSKTFRIGVRAIDKEIFAKFPKIEEAISEPFRVLDQRGEANKKYCHPREEDEVWRMKGISKNGIYHNRLLSNDIKTVGDFLKIYEEMGGDYLKKLLGSKVPKKTWNVMVHNALECISHRVPDETSKTASIEQSSMGNEAMGVEAFNENSFKLQDFDFLFEDWSLSPREEAFNFILPHP